MSRLQDLIAELCPDGVEYKELGEVFEKRNGYTPSKSNSSYWEGGTIPWFRMEDIRANGTVLDDAIQHVTDAALKKGGAFPANSIIVATSATIGAHALITCDFLCNQRFTCLSLREAFANCFDLGFLNHYFVVLDEYCLANVNQGSFASVKMGAFDKFRIPVPPIEVQHEVVRILDEYTVAHDELVRQLEEEMELLSKQREIALMDLNDDLVSSGYPFEPLGDHADVLSGFPFKSSGYVDEGIPVCGGVSIMPGYIDWTTCRYWPTAEGLDQFVLKSGDIVMALDRPWVSGGFKLAQISEDDGNPLLVQRTARVRGKDMIQPFIRALMEMDAFREHCAATGNTVPHVSHKKIESYMVPVPPIDRQEDYVRKVGGISSATRAIVDNLNSERAYLNQQLALVRNQLLSFPEKVA